MASETIEARCRELSKVMGDILGGGSEWFSRVGDEFYIDPKIARAELQRRKTDAIITRKALFRDRAAVAELVEAIEQALKCTVLVRGSQIIFDREDPREILRSALSRHQAGLGKGDDRG